MNKCTELEVCISGHMFIGLFSLCWWVLLRLKIFDTFNALLLLFSYVYLVNVFSKKNSTRVQHRTVSRDKMQWRSYFESLWIVKMLAEHTCRTITELKIWNEWDMEKLWNEICARRKRVKPGEWPTQTPFRSPRKPHEVTEKRTRDPSGGRRETNRLRHGAAFGERSRLKILKVRIMHSAVISDTPSWSMLFKHQIYLNYPTF